MPRSPSATSVERICLALLALSGSFWFFLALWQRFNSYAEAVVFEFFVALLNALGLMLVLFWLFWGSLGLCLALFWALLDYF